MMIVRPCSLADLPAIEDLAVESDIGITTLPVNKEKLRERLELSIRSFDDQTEEFSNYLFVVENTDNQEVVGVAGIITKAGAGRPFYSYRREDIIHSSPALGVHNRIPSLHLCHDLTDKTQLCSFYVREDYKQTPIAELLSRARLLFVAEHPERFGDHLIAEIPGVLDDNENSPFWDSVGNRFFGVDYSLAEYYSGVKSQAFIAEMMPPYPIYVPLLTSAAQEAIGQANTDALQTLSYLRKEGMKPTQYVDIFDGGPTLMSSVKRLLSVRNSRKMHVDFQEKEPRGGYHLVTNTECSGFRACLVHLQGAHGESLPLSQSTGQRLGLNTGDSVRVIEL
jgi:arginine N-succinyltransferase